ncbi:M15 family metallopeptidase [Streptomyces sp. NPDC058284]|uniref:M15 family metallopeptidase n=1 Tax=unclassified Streptomyces TaxID=2593676 RepID=UPI00364DB588
MTRIPPSARSSPRRIRRFLVVGLLVLTAAIAAVLGRDVLESSFSSTPLPTNSLHREHGESREPRESGESRESRDALDEADGVVPDGVTVFDDSVPAVANLDPDLLKALHRAAGAAADDGVEFYVNSGWRSSRYQNQLLREAVDKYGSKDEAARWVATAATSPHVSGDAVDIGRSQATAWLSEHGAAYGLCPLYENEPWHYELRPEAADGHCPRMYADPSQDPRMQQ